MSAQPRRKYPRRAPLTVQEEIHTQKIEKIRDISDAEFAPKTSFIETSPTKSSYIIMEDAGDRSSASRRRKNNTKDTFGLQTPNFEGKKGSVKNWRPLIKTTNESSPIVTESSYAELWNHLKDATDLVFQGENVKQPFESLYNKVELICVNKNEAAVFRDLHSSFKHHIAQWMSTIELRARELDDESFLAFIEEEWQNLCRKIKLIRCIFLVLDRTFCLQRSDIPSIWDMGIAMCRQCVVASTTEGKIFEGLLKTIEKERNGEKIDRNLLKNVTRMLSDLSLYETGFEELFIKATKNLYSVESQQQIQEQDISLYLKYVEKRLQEEEDRFEQGMVGVGYLQISTRKKLIPTVEEELIEKHQKTIVSKGTFFLIDGNKMEDLKLMFQLLSRTNFGLNEFSRSFCEYIKNRGRVIVMDEGSEKNMVVAMLELKQKTEDILVNCFKNSLSFKDGAREGFEHFINQRQNKPAEMIAKFVDSKLKAGNKASSEDELDKLMDRLLILFRYIHGKDVFEAFYKKDLAKRLLLGLSASVDSEKLMLQKLKTECGSAFTSRLEGMFRDIEVSKEHMTVFKNYNSHPNKSEKSAMDFTVSVLTHGIWPNYSPSEATLPEDMSQYLSVFEKFYVDSHNGRKLQWLANLGQCRLNGVYGKVKKELQVSQLQALVLLLFNNVDELSFAEIKAATNVESEELKRVLGSLSCNKTVIVLNKTGNAQTISLGDSFSYNAGFTHKSVRIKINAIQAQDTPEEEQKTQEGVLADRQYQIDAAIVRIMKTRKSLKHNLLMAEIYKQLRFPVTPNDLKKRIESLIERDYMARDRDDQTVFNYVA